MRAPLKHQLTPAGYYKDRWHPPKTCYDWMGACGLLGGASLCIESGWSSVSSPEKSNQSSPLMLSGIPLRTSSLVFSVRYIHTPCPYSAKWFFHACSFRNSLAWTGTRKTLWYIYYCCTLFFSPKNLLHLLSKRLKLCTKIPGFKWHTPENRTILLYSVMQAHCLIKLELTKGLSFIYIQTCGCCN